MGSVFRPSHGWRVGKSREESSLRVSCDRGKPLSLLTFFAAAKKVSRQRRKLCHVKANASAGGTAPKLAALRHGAPLRAQSTARRLLRERMLHGSLANRERAVRLQLLRK